MVFSFFRRYPFYSLKIIIMATNVVLAGNLNFSTYENYVSRAQKNGYKVSNTVTNETTFLVCGSECEQSIIKKASDFGARIISEEKWLNTLLKSEASQPTGMKRSRNDNNSKNGCQKKLIYLECRQKNRFWQMRRIYKTTYIRTGSIGTKGTGTSKEHKTKKLAKDSMILLITAKKASGYIEAKRPQILDYEDSSDSSEDDIYDENEYKQKKQKLDDEDPESDATLRDDEISDVNNVPSENCAVSLKEEGEEMNEDLSNINSLPPLPSYVTNPKNIMSIMNGNTVNVLLAFLWKPDEVDPTGWWISEKLDGVRAFWNSKRKRFFSRNGNEFVPPSWLVI